MSAHWHIEVDDDDVVDSPHSTPREMIHPTQTTESIPIITPNTTTSTHAADVEAKYAADKDKEKEKDQSYTTQKTAMATIPLMSSPTSASLMTTFKNDKSRAYLTTAGFASQPDLHDLTKLRPSEPRYAPQDKVGIIGRVLFSWLTPLMVLGAKRQLQNDDLYENWREDSNAVVWAEFKPVWERKLREEKEAKIAHEKAKAEWEAQGSVGKPKLPPLRPARLISVYKEIYGALYLWSGLLWAVSNADQLLGPFFLDHLLTYAAAKYYGQDLPAWDGYKWGVCLFCSALVASICRAHSFHQTTQIALRVRNSLISVIFQKSLRLVAKEKKDGAIVNLMAADSQKIIDFSMMLHQSWSAPIVMAVGVYQMYQQVGNAALAGLGVLFLSIPIAGVLTKRQAAAQRATSLETDKRIGIINEFIQGIRVVKFYAWEKPLMGVVNTQREAELKQLTRLAVAKSLTFGILSFVPMMAAVTIFAVYAYSGGQITASRVFTTVALVNVIRFPFTFLPMAINAIVQILVSFSRIETFLHSAEINENQREPLDHVGVELDNVALSWADEPEKDTNPRLTNINLSVAPGELVSIVGPVASGKSTLLLGLLGETNQIRGHTRIGGKIAYVPQSAFIVNTTLKENILFGLPYDAARYEEVIHACALKADIEQLPNGDLTEIGERGINISGGQKQRVSLARAAYNRDVDLVLLDDPLSAVDSHVAAHIFEHCIHGLLRGKTIIFVTHNLSFLTFSDKVVVLKEHTKDSYTIGGCDTYENLIRNNESFAALLEMYNKGKADMGMSKSMSLTSLKASTITTTTKEEEKTTALVTAAKAAATAPQPATAATSSAGTVATTKTKEEKGRLVDTEEREEGEISWRVWVSYFTSGARPPLLLCLGLVFCTVQTFTTLADYWLSHWSNNIGAEAKGIPNPYSKAQYIGYYAGIAGIIVGASVVRTLGIAFLGVSSGRTLHHKLTNNIMAKNMVFFDRTPVGRIINRFTKDFYVVDIQMPQTIEFTLNTFIATLGILIVISITIPYALIGFAVLVVIYYRIQGQYRKTSREIQRIEAISRTPIFSHFTETLGGVISIRALNACASYTATNSRHVDNNSKSFYLSKATGFWLRMRLDLMAAVIVALAAFLGLAAGDSLTPGNFGLMLSYSLGICNMLNWSVIMLTQVEAYMNSVERIQYYSRGVDLENWSPKDPAVDTAVRQAKVWPSEGRIVFDNVQMKYRDDLELVLKGITLTIEPGQRVGVVGRTGSGKSSTLMTLFRMTECCGGRIIIDGVDISQISLEALRSGLSIIPQEPVLFSGTFKYNLDPFGVHTDAEVWQALEYVQLRGVVERMPLQLSTLVADAGSNLSLGQRQLLCLARALLRNSKVICLDEATASVDAETDKVIQDIIRSKFAGSTVLTIAHRLNTILDYDRILVLDHGEIAEFDTPEVLRNKEDGIFAGMLASASKKHEKDTPQSPTVAG